MEVLAVQENNHLKTTVKKLNKKYNSNRVINEQKLTQPSKLWKGVLAVIMDLFFGVLVIFSGLFCFNVLNNRIQGTPASFFGYNALRIVSGSMQPEFKVGDAIMVHAVNTHTLKVGDKIAFYVYNSNPSEYSTKILKPINNDSAITQYESSFKQILGIQTDDIREAAHNGATLVFHQIVGIEEDQDGVWWFKTKGTNNSKEDEWHIEQQYVVGIYANSAVLNGFSKLLNSASSSWMFLIILIIPVAILAFMIVRNSAKDFQLAKLELDCVEEKRKITDPICVKNQVGYRMDRKTKYKVLATAPEDKKMEYVNALWKPHEVPHCVRKYYLKQGALLGPLQKLRDINRECEKMFKEGKDINYIGRYYETEREKINQELKTRYERILKMK